MSSDLCLLCGNVDALLFGGDDPTGVGGAQMQLLRLARELGLKGWSVVLAVEDPHAAAGEMPPDVEVVPYYFGWNKVAQAASIWRAWARADAKAYAVRGATRWLPLLRLFCRLRGRRTAFFMSTNADLQAGGLRGRVLRAAVRGCDVVFAQSLSQVSLLEQRWGVSSVLARNLVDIPPAYTCGGERNYCLWVGSLRPNKGPERILTLAAALPQIRFVVAGGVAREWAGAFADLVPRLEQAENVTYLGFVPPERLAGYLEDATVLINTSDHLPGLESLEGFPNSFLQAWAMGVPTVSLNNDPDGLIAQRRLGAASADLDSMAHDILELWDDEAKRRECGMRARRLVEEVFDLATALDTVGRALAPGPTQRSRGTCSCG